MLCLTEPGIGYLAVLEFNLGIEPVAHTAAGIAEQHALLLGQRRQMGVPVEHQLDIQFQRPAAQGQQRGLDAVSMPMGEQNPYAVQFQQAFGFTGFAPVAVAQHGNEPLVQQIGGTFGVPDAVAAEAARLGLPHSATPHSTYSLQDKPFREIAHRDNPLSIHFMESPGEQELFEGRGRLHARNLESGVGIDFAGYGSPASRIVASVPPDKNILLIHNTFVDEEVIDRIESHFEPGRVTWVLCPRSNDFIEGAHPPATLLHRKGVRIAIGTDSLASNETLSMPGEMKLLPEISLHDRIRWATLTGAEALGIDSWAGSFTPGKRPGAILLTGIDLGSMTLRTDAASRRIV